MFWHSQLVLRQYVCCGIKVPFQWQVISCHWGYLATPLFLCYQNLIKTTSSMYTLKHVAPQGRSEVVQIGALVWVRVSATYDVKFVYEVVSAGSSHYKSGAWRSQHWNCASYSQPSEELEQAFKELQKYCAPRGEVVDSFAMNILESLRYTRQLNIIWVCWKWTLMHIIREIIFMCIFMCLFVHTHSF